MTKLIWGERQAAEWRGIREGWVPIGQPRPAQDAERLVALVARVRPHMTHKVM